MIDLQAISKKATTAEVVTGTATDSAVTPAGVSARMAEPGAIGGTTPAAGAFTTLKASINVETLAATKTLVVTDYMVQWLNPDGVSRNVVLPAEASSTNLMFIILNTGTTAAFNLVIKNAAAVVKATLGPGMSGIFSCDGTNWKWENDTGVYSDAVKGNIEIEGLLSQIGLGGSTYFGYGAGKVDDLVSRNNTGIGYMALYYNTTGYYNTAVGMSALLNNTTGYYNTAVGLDALYSNTTGHRNTALGVDALYKNTTGYSNTALGVDALNRNTTGLRNIALGFEAGKYELGSDTLYVNNQNRTNSANERLTSIIYGQMAALVADQKLTFNAAVTVNGYLNAINQTNAIENQSKLLQTEDIFSDFVVTGLLPATSANLISDISLGHAYVTGTRVNKAVTSKTYTASKDTYVDINSAGTYTFVEAVLDAAAPAVTADSIRLAKVVTDADNITGVTDLRELQGIFSSRNVKINGLLSQDGLGGSTYFGFEAGKVDDLTDNLNTGIGYQALLKNTTGYRNTALGRYALRENTTGYYNTALGMQTLQNNIDGYHNTAVGQDALLNNTSGYQNTALGMYTSVYNSTGYQNTALGNYALFNNSTGLRNIAIGFMAGKYELGSDKLYINNQTRTNTTEEKLKSIIYGIMAAAVADQRLTFNADVEIAGPVTIKGGQIVFPATAVPSANVNTLDDYEEGTWTPTLKFGGNSVGMTYSTQEGVYTKIGDLVYVQLYIILSAKGTSTGAASITGVPFAGKTDVSFPANLRPSGITFANQMVGYGSASEIFLQEVTEAGVVTNLAETDFVDTSRMMCSYSYVA